MRAHEPKRPPGSDLPRELGRGCCQSVRRAQCEDDKQPGGTVPRCRRCAPRTIAPLSPGGCPGGRQGGAVRRLSGGCPGAFRRLLSIGDPSAPPPAARQAPPFPSFPCFIPPKPSPPPADLAVQNTEAVLSVCIPLLGRQLAALSGRSADLYKLRTRWRRDMRSFQVYLVSFIGLGGTRLRQGLSRISSASSAIDFDQSLHSLLGRGTLWVDDDSARAATVGSRQRAQGWDVVAEVLATEHTERRPTRWDTGGQGC